MTRAIEYETPTSQTSIRRFIFTLFLLFGTVVTYVPSNTEAGGYGLSEQSASGIGNAFAGSAASAEDASTAFWNPAGMTYLPNPQLVITAHLILPTAEFSNSGSQSAFGAATQGNNGGNAGNLTLIPNIYFTKAIHPNLWFGISINSPFGLGTEYDNQWTGRYQGIKSKLETVSINPSIAFKTSDQLSIGFGVSAMKANASISSAVDFGTLCTGFALGCGAPQAKDGLANIKADSWGWGWNAGLLYQFNNRTRVGLAYRSQVRQKLEGTASFTDIPSPALNNLFPNGDIHAEITTPDNLSASLFHQWNEQWDVMSDITWTHWQKFQNLTVIRSSGAVVLATDENWQNTIRLSVGSNYHYSEKLKLRAGLAYDPSAVKDGYLTVRIPDGDRYWLSFGANYKFSADNSLDAGFTHIFVEDRTINKVNDVSAPALKDTVTGSYSSNINIISLQLVHTF